jgi:hypothetical protein
MTATKMKRRRKPVREQVGPQVDRVVFPPSEYFAAAVHFSGTFATVCPRCGRAVHVVGVGIQSLYLSCCCCWCGPAENGSWTRYERRGEQPEDAA